MGFMGEPLAHERFRQLTTWLMITDRIIVGAFFRGAVPRLVRGNANECGVSR